MNVKLLYVLSPGVLLFLLSCGWLTGPDDDEVDPRKLTWTVDTLAYPESFQTLMGSIWGSSPDDVYTVGHNSKNRGLMWHFDGNEWTDVALSTTQGGNIEGPITVDAIDGFGPDDIWAVGGHSRFNPDPPPDRFYSPLVIHYDGIAWWEVETPQGGILHAVGGGSPDDLWAGGRYGTLFHYDGTAWERDSIPLALAYDSSRFSYFRRIEGSASALTYALYFEPLHWSFLLRFEGDQWTVQDSFNWDFHHALWMSPTEELYSADIGGVRSWEAGHWQPLLEEEVTLLGITGTADDNLFAVGFSWSDGHGVVYHYNGEDWYRYPKPEGLPQLLTDIWTDGREVFIVGYTSDVYPEVSIILHGR